MKMKEKVRKFLEEHWDGIEREVTYAVTYLYGFGLGCVAYKIYTMCRTDFTRPNPVLETER